MSSSGLSERLTVLLIGVVVIMAPVVIVLLTVAFLVFTGDLVLRRVTPLEFVELYLIDLALFAAFAYGLYWLTLRLIDSRLPTSLDALDNADAEQSRHEATDDHE